MSNEQTVEQPEVQRFPGQRLQAARIAKGITVEDIATALHLPSGYIHSLENGDIDKLPSVVFARGYIRSYAKIVDMDADEFIDYLDQHQDDQSNGRSIKSVTKVRQQIKASHPLVRVSTWLVLAIVIGASIWWWKTQNTPVDTAALPSVAEESIAVDSSDGSTLQIPALDDSLPAKDVDTVVSEEHLKASVSESADSSEQAEKVEETVSEDAPVEESIDQDSAETDTTSEQASVAEVVAVAEAAIEVEVPVVETPSETAQLSALKVVFSGECWVTIKDNNGKTLFNNVRNSGDVVEVSGSVPVSVLLGNTSAVESFTFNGDLVELSPLSRNGVARFSLPLE